MPSSKWKPLKLTTSKKSFVPSSEEDRLIIETLYERCEGLKRLKKDVTLWTNKISRACPTTDVKALTTSFSNYSDKLTEDDEQQLIGMYNTQSPLPTTSEKAAHRTGSVIQFMDDQQKALASKVTESFQKPGKDFLDNDIAQSLIAINNFEKASESYKTANKRLKSALKKLNNSQKQGEAQQEQIAARTYWEQQKEYAHRLVSKTTAKHEYFTLEMLNELVVCYKEFFTDMTKHFSVLEDELEFSMKMAVTKREDFQRNYPPDFVPPAPTEDQPLLVPRNMLSETHGSDSAKKKRKRSTSIDKRYNIITELLEREREYHEQLRTLHNIKTKLLREEGVSQYVNSIYNIFSNIDELETYQKRFVSDLIALVNNWNSSGSMGTFFSVHSKEMTDLYSSYARNFIASTLSLRKARKFSTFDQLLRETEEAIDSQVASLLPTVLSHPMRMRDVIQNLLHDLARHNIDHRPLSEALTSYSAICRDIDQCGFSTENLSRLQELQNKIHGTDEQSLVIAEPHRTFLKEGFVSVDFDHVKGKKKREEFFTFLFSDLIIFTKRQAPPSILKKRGVSYSYQYVDHDFLYRAAIEFDDIRRGVRLICPSKVYCMYWDKSEYQDSWCKILVNIISELQKPKTFGVPFREVMRRCQNQKIVIPTFVVDCVQYILAKGLSTRGLFRELPFEEEAEGLRVALDHEEAVSFEESSPLTVAWLLLRWLRELPEPVIPYSYYSDVIQADTPEKAKELLESLPIFNQYVLEYIMGCCECVASHPKTDMDSLQLAVLFTPYIIRQAPNCYTVDHLQESIQFVLFMIADFNITFQDITQDRIKTQEDTQRINELFRQYSETPPRSLEIQTRMRARSVSTGAVKRPESSVKSSLAAEATKKTSHSSGFVRRKPRSKTQTNLSNVNRLSGSVPSLLTQAPPSLVIGSSTQKNERAPLTSPRYRICRACSQTVGVNGVSILGHIWHENCFVCATCKGAFANGKFYENNGLPYCDNCFRDQLICASCNESIEGSFTRAMDKYWHPEHFCCSTCSVPLQEGFFEESNKFFCASCLHSKNSDSQ